MKVLLGLVAMLEVGCLLSTIQLHGGNLRQRAAYDLQCAEDQLVITDLGGRAAGVEGCRRRATYVYDGNAGTWILNSPTGRS